MPTQPSIELKGTVKGTLETPLDLSSSMKTTVTEKLLKELDRRSTWLNANRNLLRITQRGMEAANIAGSFKEKVTLRIPQSFSPVHYFDLVADDIKIKSTSQPLYGTVPAVSVSLGVVREPYKVKRSATEKFGLPDSSDARYLVVVAEPVQLNLWQWDRAISGMSTDEISIDYVPPLHSDRKAKLMYFHPGSGTQGPFFLAPNDEKFFSHLRNSLQDLLPSMGNSKGRLGCRWVSPAHDAFYLLLNPKSLQTEQLWIGKEDKKGELNPFDGKESIFLGRVKSENGCS